MIVGMLAVEMAFGTAGAGFSARRLITERYNKQIARKTEAST
jgi:hypothetical protein